MRPRFRLMLPVATTTLAAALMLVTHAEQRAHDARCEASSAEEKWDRAIGKIPPGVTRLDFDCMVFINSPPPATPATIVVGLVGLPAILFTIPFLFLEAALDESGIALHSVAWLVGIAFFWNHVGNWFDDTLSDEPAQPEAPHFLTRFYFGCLLFLSPPVFVLFGLHSLWDPHGTYTGNNILMLGVFMVWSGLGTFLLVRRYWNNDVRITESTKQDQQS